MQNNGRNMNILVSSCLLGVACRYDGGYTPCDTLLRLLSDDGITLIPVCPEQLGGLPTPRVPCERCGGRVVGQNGADLTAQFERGANETLKLARLYRCAYAILKERSPSCGFGKVYDGTFTGALADGSGVTAELLSRNGIQIVGESRAEELLSAIRNRDKN